MKNLITKLLHTLIILTSIIVLGIFIPLTVSVFISILTPATFTDCTTSIPFWLVTIICWAISAVYVNDVITNQQ